jgi:hypothetical protein
MKCIEIQAIPKAHPHIRAGDWLSPLVCRLHPDGDYTDGCKTISFSIRPAGGDATGDACDFRWRGMRADYEQVRRTYQEPVITEFATLALACVTVGLFAQMQITEVTRRGDRADYWLGDRELLLEVSGQQDGNLQALHSDKAKQLRENPYEKDGFICVANYTSAKADFWYYEYET